MLARAPRKASDKPALIDLLDLWHGDRDSNGWASPTLALNIALMVKPVSVQELAEKIYLRFSDGNTIPIPQYDKELMLIIRQGFNLYAARK
jgi:hypothetical protein